jgi:transcriptional regulator with XRE-family HTH domain
MRDPNAHASALKRRLATNVRRLRHEAGMTQEALAEAADLDRRHVTKIEAAEANVTIGTLCKLSNALGVTPADLLARPPRGC